MDRLTMGFGTQAANEDLMKKRGYDVVHSDPENLVVKKEGNIYRLTHNEVDNGKNFFQNLITPTAQGGTNIAGSIGPAIPEMAGAVGSLPAEVSRLSPNPAVQIGGGAVIGGAGGGIGGAAGELQRQTIGRGLMALQGVDQGISVPSIANQGIKQAEFGAAAGGSGPLIGKAMDLGGSFIRNTLGKTSGLGGENISRIIDNPSTFSKYAKMSDPEFRGEIQSAGNELQNVLSSYKNNVQDQYANVDLKALQDKYPNASITKDQLLGNIDQTLRDDYGLGITKVPPKEVPISSSEVSQGAQRPLPPVVGKGKREIDISKLPQAAQDQIRAAQASQLAEQPQESAAAAAVTQPNQSVQPALKVEPLTPVGKFAPSIGKQRLQQLNGLVNDINSMDQSNLSLSDLNELRTRVRDLAPQSPRDGTEKRFSSLLGDIAGHPGREDAISGAVKPASGITQILHSIPEVAERDKAYSYAITQADNLKSQLKDQTLVSSMKKIMGGDNVFWNNIAEDLKKNGNINFLSDLKDLTVADSSRRFVNHPWIATMGAVYPAMKIGQAIATGNMHSLPAIAGSTLTEGATFAAMSPRVVSMMARGVGNVQGATKGLITKLGLSPKFVREFVANPGFQQTVMRSLKSYNDSISTGLGSNKQPVGGE